MAESMLADNLPSGVWTRLEEIIRRFEEEWKAGRQPAIDGHLPADPVERHATLRELVHLDLEYRWKRGEEVAADTYLSRYPQLTADPTISLELRAAEQQFRQRQQAGPTPNNDRDRTIAMSDDGRRETGGAVEEPPTVAGYQILRALGRGGMGIVYLARDQRLQRLVALKMLLPEAATRASVERFRREAEVVARLQHPNIVQIFQVGEQDHHPYLTLEYVDGGNLAEHIAQAPLTVRATAQLLETVARAVHHAHTHGLIHRDLKPANILLAGGPALTPKITDFGLAKLLADDAHQSQSGTIVGTPTYMAPEQALGKTALIGPPTDVYALGTILYEMLTGRPPFHGESATDVMLNIVSVEPVPPRRFQPKVPRDLETICLKCLEKNPGCRYASAAALADDLARFLSGAPIQARPIGPTERLWRWAHRNRLTAGLAAAVLLSLVAGTAVATSFGLEARSRAAQALSEKQQAEKEKRRADDQTEVALAQEQKANEHAREAKAANAEAQREKVLAQQEQRKAQRLAATLALDHGLHLCGQGQPDHGLLWLSRSLELTALDDGDLQRVVRANLTLWRGHLHSLRLDLSHPDWVMAAAYRPDGQRILTGGRDKLARFWDVRTGSAVGKPLPHDGPVSAVAYQPDGKVVATASGFNVRLWIADTGQIVGQPLGHRFRVDHLVYNPDGQSLLTVTALSTFHLWDAKTGQALPFEPEWEDANRPPPLRALAFTPDGKTLLAAIGSTVRLWDVGTGKFKGDPLVHPAGVTAIGVSPDCKTLLTGCADHLIRRWDLSTGKRLPQSLPRQGIIRTVTFSPDGKLGLAAGLDGTARLWELSTGQPIGQPLQHPDLQVAQFSPDGKQVLTAGLDRAARVWEVASRNDAAEVQLNDAPAEAFISRDGKAVLTWHHGKESADWWDASKGKLLRATASHGITLSAAALSSDGSIIATANNRGLRLEECATGKPLPTAIPLPGLATKMAFSADSKTLAAAVLNGTTWRVYLWEWSTGKQRGVWDLGDSARVAAVHAVAFSPDGQCVLAALSDGTVRFWDVTAGAPLKPLLRHEAAVWAAAFSPDGRQVVTGSFDGTARVWDAVTGTARGQPFQHFSKVWAVAFSPDGTRILTGSDDRRARVWDIATGRLLGPPQHQESPVQAAAFDSTGQRVTCVAWDQLGGRMTTICTWMVPLAAEEPADRLTRGLNAATRLTLETDGRVQPLTRQQWDQLRQRVEADAGKPEQP